LIPKQNEDDFNKIKKENKDLLKKGVFEVNMVETFREVLEFVLEDFDNSEIIDE
jgi:predicted ATP-dependent protease